MLVRTINDAYALQRAMVEANRDYYTLRAYEILIDYFDESETPIEFDAVGISGDFNEEDLETIKDNYDHLTEFEDVDWNDEESVCDALNEHTIAWVTGNRTILYGVF